jgi:hypothetical protein
MNSLLIFGKKYRLKGRREDDIQKRLNELASKFNGKESAQIIKEFLADLLHSELAQLYGQILDAGKIDVFGTLDFEVTETIDKRMRRIAKMKDNRIIVKLNAISLPRSALKYVVSHEMAHLVTKKHGNRFWKTVESIYPGYEDGQRLFIRSEEILRTPLISV